MLLLLLLGLILILELANSSVDAVADCDVFCYGGGFVRQDSEALFDIVGHFSLQA